MKAFDVLNRCDYCKEIGTSMMAADDCYYCSLVSESINQGRIYGEPCAIGDMKQCHIALEYICDGLNSGVVKDGLHTYGTEDGISYH